MSKVKLLARQLERRILSGEWVPGDKIPTQVRLMSELGVARTTLREAISLLQSRGFIKARHGSGTYIVNLFEQGFLPPINQLSMHDPKAQLAVLEMRQVLEGLAAWHACERASDAELMEIDAEYQRMLQRAVDVPLLVRAKADLTFHMLIAKASHNLLVASLSQLLYNKMFNTIFAALSSGMLEQPGSMEAIDQQHARIHFALMARDAQEVRREAQEHGRHTAQMLGQQLQ